MNASVANPFRRASLVLIAAILTVTAAGCGAKQPEGDGPAGTVSSSGSTALLPLVAAAKELIEEKYERVTVNVSGGGSFNGLSQVANDAVQIGNSDIEPTGDLSKGLVDHKVAVAPFVIITNKDVTVPDMTLEQLAQILRGEISNWNVLGGRDAPIIIVNRQQSSGSRATIVAKVLGGHGDITKTAMVQDSNGKVLDSVASTPGAIGYVDAPYYKPDQVSAIKLGGIAYSVEAVTSGKWPIYAYEHMYTKGEPVGATKAVIEFVLGKEFQDSVVSRLGFIPVTALK